VKAVIDMPPTDASQDELLAEHVEEPELEVVS